VLSTGPRLMAATGLPFEPAFSTTNGGLKVQLAGCVV
jgi:hypothetical protein